MYATWVRVSCVGIPLSINAIVQYILNAKQIPKAEYVLNGHYI